MPWNFPMPIASWGFAPALAAGNTVVVKPAETTPLRRCASASLVSTRASPRGFCRYSARGPLRAGGSLPTRSPQDLSGFPPALNSVAKRQQAGVRGAGEEGHSRARGKERERRLCRRRPRPGGGRGSLRGVRQCVDRIEARSALLIEEDAYERFMELNRAVRMIRAGDPADKDVEMGPLISLAAQRESQSYVEESEVAFRGSAPHGKGFWYPPTVLAPADMARRSFQEEIFGPVVSVVRFSGEADAVAIANDGHYGLSGSIWTRDLAKGIRVARAVESGALSVNSNSSVRYHTPFGGYKQSGLGRELGPDALLGFSEEKNVFISTEG